MMLNPIIEMIFRMKITLSLLAGKVFENFFGLGVSRFEI